MCPKHSFMPILTGSDSNDHVIGRFIYYASTKEPHMDDQAVEVPLQYNVTAAP
ncbi:MAG: Uncharacterised protein [Halieaceae bacterium]|nr:MAG: Uncharacterised protein [Halieaceae bacterium]